MAEKELYDACHGNMPYKAMQIALTGVGFNDYADENGQTALHLASCPVRMAPVIRMAVDKGTDVGIKTKDGRTPLYYAARFGNLDACKALLDGGAKNTKASFGKTPLQRAEEEGHTAVAQLLQSAFGDRARLASSARRLDTVIEDVLHVLSPGASKAVSHLVVLQGSQDDSVPGILELYKKSGTVNKKFDKNNSLPATRIKLDKVENVSLDRIQRSKLWDCITISSDIGETTLYGKPMERLDLWATKIKANMGARALSFVTASGADLQQML